MKIQPQTGESFCASRNQMKTFPDGQMSETDFFQAGKKKEEKKEENKA